MTTQPGGIRASSKELEGGALQDRRTTPRFALLFQAAKLVSIEGESLCVVQDVSAEGVRVRHFGHLPVERSFRFELANGEIFEVETIWHDKEYAGLKFPDTVDLDRLVRLAGAGQQRRQLRVKTLLEGLVVCGNVEFCMTVRNISQQGMCIECRTPLEIGSPVTIETETMWPTLARVRWRISTLHGLVFDQPLPGEQLAHVLADARHHR